MIHHDLETRHCHNHIFIESMAVQIHASANIAHKLSVLGPILCIPAIDHPNKTGLINLLTFSDGVPISIDFHKRQP